MFDGGGSAAGKVRHPQGQDRPHRGWLEWGLQCFFRRVCVCVCFVGVLMILRWRLLAVCAKNGAIL